MDKKVLELPRRTREEIDKIDNPLLRDAGHEKAQFVARRISHAMMLCALAGFTLTSQDAEALTVAQEFVYNGKTPRDLVNGDGDWKTGADLEFALCTNKSRAFDNTDTQEENTIVITHAGLVAAGDSDLTAYRNLIRLGSVKIESPESNQGYRVKARALVEYLAAEGALQGRVAIDGNAEAAYEGMLSPGRPDVPMLDVPLVVQVKQNAKLIIEDIPAGTAADAEAFLVYPRIKGFILHGLTK